LYTEKYAPYMVKQLCFPEDSDSYLVYSFTISGK